MEEGYANGGGGHDGDYTYWWWAAPSTVQLGWGIYCFRKGYAGESRLMPVKAFGVASLFLGGTTTAAVGTQMLPEFTR